MRKVRYNMKNLAYWKGRLLDAREAYRRAKSREYLEAVRYALRKISVIESKVFKIGEIE